MIEKLTIADAAAKAIESLGKPATAEEVYAEIIRLNLYTFNTPTPVHVVETELKRYSSDSERSDKRADLRFRLDPDKTYTMQPTQRTSSKRSQAKGMKRILRASDKDEFIEELMSNSVGVFKEIWRLLLFAAQVGIKEKKREPLRSFDTGKGIDQATFGNSASWPGIVYLMSLAEAGESEILAGTPEGEDLRISLFQEYANGGLSVMREFFKSRAIDLDGVLSFIESNQGDINSGLAPLDLDLLSEGLL